jgi:Ser/Thr protein kinase RdoA (MazF antagonist)
VPPRNHKRIGRVQRGVRRAFIVAPDWTTRELMAWTHTLALYRGRRSRWQRHDYAKSIRRAADRLATRVGRRWPDGIVWRARE